MTTGLAHAPDPMDGLHLALMQQRRKQLLATASGKTIGLKQGMMLVVLIGGIAVAASGGLRTASQVLCLGLGLFLIFDAVYLWWALRHSARQQLRKLDQQIEATALQPDAAVIAEAAIGARTFLLKQRQ